MTEAQHLMHSLTRSGLTIALAESVTCGLASCALGSLEGAGEAFKGSIISYGADVKTTLLQVKKELIEKYSAESMEVTEAMAKGLKKIIDADICAAITGLATAGGSETPEKPVGTIFVSARFKSRFISEKKVFSGTPQKIKDDAARFLFSTIKSLIDQDAS